MKNFQHHVKSGTKKNAAKCFVAREDKIGRLELKKKKMDRSLKVGKLTQK